MLKQVSFKVGPWWCHKGHWHPSQVHTPSLTLWFYMEGHCCHTKKKNGRGVSCNYVKVSRDNFPCYLIVKGSVSQNYMKCFIFWNDEWKLIKTRQRHWTGLSFQVFPTGTDAMHFKIPLTLHILIFMSSTVFRITLCLKPSLKYSFIKLCKQAIELWLCLISLTLICYHEITWKWSSKMWNFSHNYAILKTFFYSIAALSFRSFCLLSFSFQFQGGIQTKQQSSRNLFLWSPPPHCGDGYHTVWFRVHERQSDLSRGGVGLPAESIYLLPSSHSRYALQGQEGLALKVISPQRVVVQDCHHQTRAQCLALVQGHQAAGVSKRQSVKVWTAEFKVNRDQNSSSSQLECLVEERVEVPVFDLGAARLHLGKDVSWFQTELHEGVAET